jgi:hypothetical protein
MLYEPRSETPYLDYLRELGRSVGGELSRRFRGIVEG